MIRAKRSSATTGSSPRSSAAPRALDHHSLLRVVHRRAPLLALQLADLPGEIDAHRHLGYQRDVELPNGIPQTIQTRTGHATLTVSLVT
jgi:hypothetical protein